MRFFCFIFVCLFGCVERCNPEMLFFWPIIIVVFNIQTCACFTGFVPSYFIFLYLFLMIILDILKVLVFSVSVIVYRIM